MVELTFISDTHQKHRQITRDLPGGEILIHAGDIMTSGYHEQEIYEFLDWFEGIQGYDTKIFIAGNHDRLFENEPEKVRGILSGYKTIDYLEDEQLTLYYDGHNGDFPEDNIRIYGSPHTPYFNNWAFNLPRNGPGLASKWEAIPANTDILVTHGPAWGYCDTVEGRRDTHLGCELLAERIAVIKPKIHICGHIHSGVGYTYNNGTHYFNASVLNEQYAYTNKPVNVKWDSELNEIYFV